jgi:hypothetical protein
MQDLLQSIRARRCADEEGEYRIEITGGIPVIVEDIEEPADDLRGEIILFCGIWTFSAAAIALMLGVIHSGLDF